MPVRENKEGVGRLAKLSRIEREVREVQGQGQVPAGSTVLRKILQGELVSQSLRDVLLSGTG